MACLSSVHDSGVYASLPLAGTARTLDGIFGRSSSCAADPLFVCSDPDPDTLQVTLLLLKSEEVSSCAADPLFVCSDPDPDTTSTSVGLGH